MACHATYNFNVAVSVSRIAKQVTYCNKRWVYTYVSFLCIVCILNAKVTLNVLDHFKIPLWKARLGKWQLVRTVGERLRRNAGVRLYYELLSILLLLSVLIWSAVCGYRRKGVTSGNLLPATVDMPYIQYIFCISFPSLSNDTQHLDQPSPLPVTSSCKYIHRKMFCI